MSLTAATLVKAAGTTVTFGKVTVSGTDATTAIARTTITYANPAKGSIDVSNEQVEAVLHKKILIGLAGEVVAKTTLTNINARYNSAAAVSAKFSNLKSSENYWVTFKEVDFPTIAESDTFTTDSIQFHFGGGDFGGGGSNGTWGTPAGSTPGTNPPPVVPITTTPKPTTPKPVVNPDPSPTPVSNCVPTIKPITGNVSNKTSTNGIPITFTAYPTVDGTSVNVTGSIKYATATGKDISALANAGTVIVNLVDCNYISQFQGMVIEKPNMAFDTEYPIKVTFPNYNRFLDEQGVPVNPALRQGPFSIRIVEDGLTVFSDPFFIGVPTSNTNGTVTNSSSSPSTTTTTTTLASSGEQSFSGSSKKYRGITMDGSLTASIDGTDLSIQGSFVYNHDLPLPDVAKGGTLSFLLTDADNYSTQIPPIKVVSDTETADYGKVYYFSPAFDNFKVHLAGADGKPAGADRKGPFTLTIFDNVLGIKVDPITVVNADQSGTIAGFNQSAGIAPDNKTVTTADGTNVTFKIDPVKFKPNAQTTVTGNIVFKKGSNTAKETDPGKTNIVVKDKDGKTIGTQSDNLVPGSFIFDQDYNFGYDFNLTTDKAPYKLTISQEKLPTVTADFTITDGTAASSGANGPVSNTTVQTQSSDVAANGSKATFTVTNSTFTPPGLVDVDATVVYTKATDGTTPVAKNITATLYDKTLSKIAEVPADIYKNKGNNFQASFFDVDPAKGPFTMSLKDTDLGVSVSGFKIATIDPNSLNNAGDAANAAAEDAASKTPGLLRNPLRKGLDSIPAIVNALVRDIVIPIAIPFLALAILYTGFLFIQARGNATKLEEAKKALKWTLIGGAIILGAYVIATALQGTIKDIIS